VITAGASQARRSVTRDGKALGESPSTRRQQEGHDAEEQHAVHWTHSRGRWAQVAVELIDAAYPEIVGRWPAGRPASDSYPICWLWPSMPSAWMS
jgi:hypothetical protein